MDSTPRRSIEEARERDRAIQGADGYQPGESVLDFTIEAIIGNGEYGEVYKAKATDDGAVLALKSVKLSEQAADDIMLIAKDPQVGFAAESAICFAIGLHPNIVSIRRVLSTRKGLLIAMDLVEGADLREFAGKMGPASTSSIRASRSWNGPLYQGGRAQANARVDSLVAQLYKGLAHMHGRAILHNDIKPEVERAHFVSRPGVGEGV